MAGVEGLGGEVGIAIHLDDVVTGGDQAVVPTGLHGLGSKVFILALAGA